MKIVIIGGTGLIGRKLVERLRGRGHEVVAASPSTGVDTVSGQGLDKALAGAEVVADVTNPTSFDADAVLAFFEASGRNLLAAEARAGVRHHLALSVVGTQRLQDNGYFRGKCAQERLIEESGVPYTIVQATQFFEFMAAIADGGAADDGTVRLSPALFQPMAADDVADVLAELALSGPLNRRIEIGGPERMGMAQAVERFLQARGDGRRIVPDEATTYFGQKMDDRALTPGEGARLTPTRLDDWLAQAQRS
ncbi:SDR family oxidoreductase [Geminicoccus flavidas]|uniref:SDR family oxidoreductase n=1 Tax=Geminicoccus flavidas TaxID=2506407 RepID=UPI0013590245|nr:SDR family oxidoreductase [Geminicoccus flavidas]